MILNDILYIDCSYNILRYKFLWIVYVLNPLYLKLLKILLIFNKIRFLIRIILCNWWTLSSFSLLSFEDFDVLNISLLDQVFVQPLMFSHTILPTLVVIEFGDSSSFHGHSSPISDTRHLFRTLVTYLGHSSPISYTFVYNTEKVECAFDFELKNEPD